MTSPNVTRMTVGDIPVNLGQVQANSLIMNLDPNNAVYISPNTDVSPSSGIPVGPSQSLVWQQAAICWAVAASGVTCDIVVSNAITNPSPPPVNIPPSLNDITFSTAAPSGTGTDNALWFQIDNPTDANVIGQWYWNGSEWVAWPLTNSVIANLDAGKINTGVLNAITLSGCTFEGGVISDSTEIPPSPPAVTYSTSTPSGSGSAVNAIWYQIDGSGNVLGQWAWNGTSWIQHQLASAILAYIDAGKITTGTLSSIDIDAVNIHAAYFSGGTIDGADIIGSTLTATVVQTATSGAYVYISGSAVSGSPGIVFADGVSATNGFMRVSSGTVNITSPVGAATSGVVAFSENGFSVSGRGGTMMTLDSLTGGGSGSIVSGGGFSIQASGSVNLSGSAINLETSTTVQGNLTVVDALTVESSETIYGNSNINGSITVGGNLNVATVASTTGSANVIWSSSSTRFYHTSSASALKLDQQPIGTEYAVLDLLPKTWVDKTFHDEDEKYSDRTAGLILEEVWDQVRGTGLESLVSKRRDNGEVESVDYDRIAVFLIPVIKDIVNRVKSLEVRQKGAA